MSRVRGWDPAPRLARGFAPPGTRGAAGHGWSCPGCRQPPARLLGWPGPAGHGCGSCSRTRGEEPPRLIAPARAGLVGLFLTVLIEAGFLLTFTLLHRYQLPGFQPTRLKGGMKSPQQWGPGCKPRRGGQTPAGAAGQISAPSEGGGWPGSPVSQRGHRRLGPHHRMQQEPSQGSLGRDTCHPSLACVPGHGSMAGIQVQLWVLLPPATPMLLGAPQL